MVAAFPDSNGKTVCTPCVWLECRFRQHRAFTIIELMVTLAIIAILLALLLPAVQQARQVARRTECSSKLRQLGVATHSYHDLFNAFPAGNLGTTGHSPFVTLLPHLEQTNLFAKFDFTVGIDESPNSALKAAKVGWLQCPADIAANFPGSTNYVANAGTGPHVDGGFEGVFNAPVIDGHILSIADITDGLSNTAAFSEVIVANHRHDPYRTVFRSPRRHDVDSLCHQCTILNTASQTGDQWSRGWPWTEGNPPSALYNHAQVPNRRACTNGTSVPDGLYPPASLHAAGVNLCLADGSVRYVSESIDSRAWRSLGTRRGGEPLTTY